MEDASLVHVIHGFDELIHVPPYPVLRHIMAAPANELINVHVHELKHKRKPACGLVTVERWKSQVCMLHAASWHMHCGVLRIWSCSAAGFMHASYSKHNEQRRSTY